MKKGTSKDEGTKAHNNFYIKQFQNNPKHLLIYLDVSLLKGRAVVGLHKGKELFREKVELEENAEVYDAEMLGLTKAATLGILYTRRNPHPITHLHIYTDNNTAIQSIFEANAKVGQHYSRTFSTAIIEFLEIDESYHIKFAWAPGHKGVKGNEITDTLAKKVCSTLSPAIATLTNARQASGDTGQRLGIWVVPIYWTRPFFNREQISTDAETKTTLQREIYGQVIQARPGHRFCSGYVHCPCGEPFQTRKHIIRDANATMSTARCFSTPPLSWFWPTYWERRTELHHLSRASMHSPKLETDEQEALTPLARV